MKAIYRQCLEETANSLLQLNLNIAKFNSTFLIESLPYKLYILLEI